MFPIITIITSTFNCAEALEKTAASIREQSYESIQWVVVDGASNGPTLKVIDMNSDIITNWISEPDEGIYDAWNKAIRMIKGDWVLFLGAGDLFDNEDALKNFWDQAPVDRDSYGALYGNVLFIEADGSPRYLSRKPNLRSWEFGRPTLPNHQGVLHNKSLFGGSNFDSSYKIAADTKFLLNALKSHSFRHIDITVSRMPTDGISNKVENIALCNEEISRLCSELDITVPKFYLWRSSMNFAVIKLVHGVLPPKMLSGFKKFVDRLRSSTK